MLNHYTLLTLLAIGTITSGRALNAGKLPNLFAKDSITVNLEAVNLSEDMSTMSSMNDEVVVLIYDFSDTSKLSKPLVSRAFVMDSMHRVKKFAIPHAEEKNRLLFFLVEQDTEKPLAQVEGIFRKHFSEILKLYNQRNRLELEKVTGTDDLLGIRIIEDFDSGPKQLSFAFMGRFKLDKFHYKILIKK